MRNLLHDDENIRERNEFARIMKSKCCIIQFGINILTALRTGKYIYYLEMNFVLSIVKCVLTN